MEFPIHSLVRGVRTSMREGLEWFLVFMVEVSQGEFTVFLILRLVR